jgi:hypothetical protein
VDLPQLDGAVVGGEQKEGVVGRGEPLDLGDALLNRQRPDVGDWDWNFGLGMKRRSFTNFPRSLVGSWGEGALVGGVQPGREETREEGRDK